MDHEQYPDLLNDDDIVSEENAAGGISGMEWEGSEKLMSQAQELLGSEQQIDDNVPESSLTKIEITPLEIKREFMQPEGTVTRTVLFRHEKKKALASASYPRIKKENPDVVVAAPDSSYSGKLIQIQLLYIVKY